MIVETLMPGENELELVLDDTLNNHVGKKIFGAGKSLVAKTATYPRSIGSKLGTKVGFPITTLSMRRS
jgi:hypothetical protein